METGTMNQRITFQKREVEVNGNGAETEKWTDYYTCWSYVNGLSGVEFWSAQVVQAERTVTFTIRYCATAAALNPLEYRLIFHGEVYNITYVDIVQYKSDTIKVKAMGMGVMAE